MKASTSVRPWAVLFWLAVWQIASMALRAAYPLGGLVLASPLAALARLGELAGTAVFWQTVARSSAHILGGFLLSCLAAVLLAVPAARYRWGRELLAPLVAAVKAVPVASFIILALFWLDSRSLALFISALMVFPPVYLNVLTGIRQTDGQLLEMARVFRVPFRRQLRGIYLPAVLPYFRSAVSVALGMCWKAGVAAEVIGLPDGSVGERLYTAKAYFQTPDLFAWTAVIVAVSILFEKLFLAAVDRLSGKAGGLMELRVEKLCKRYGGAPVLEDLSFTAGVGVTCVMAPSGVGKTTLLRVLLGLERPDSGGFFPSHGHWAAVFQENRLLEHLDAWENLRFVLGEAYDQAAAATLLSELGLGDVGTKPVREWSGGMKRRLSLARALLAESDFLALDEPFTGLDGENRERARACVRRAAERKPVLLVTHDAADAEDLDAKIVRL